MLTASDLIPLAYTPDLTEAGIAFACRSLALFPAGKNPPTFRPLRRMAAGVAVELAFRRYLQAQSIRFSPQTAAPFTGPERYEITLGGRRCQVVSYFIFHRGQVDSLRRNPAVLLQAQALIPSDEFAAEYHRSDDLYVFAFLLGVEAGATPGQRAWLVHLLPPAWSRPSQPLTLNKVTLRSEAQEPAQVELGGLNREREFVTARMELEPDQDAPVEGCFSSLAYVHALAPVRRRLVLSGSGTRQTHLILPYGWGNLWFEGLEIVLAGWLSHEEFRRKAVPVNPGSRTLQFDRTTVKNLAVPFSRLEPLSKLLEKSR